MPTSEKTPPISLGVRRWGEHEVTPIVLDSRGVCGTFSDHLRKGCIGLAIYGEGRSRLVHLTAADALRLSDLLRAMAAADAEVST